jgi:hypothetical protein
MTASNELVDRLQAAARLFAGERTMEKAAALAACARLELREPAELLAYHDALLFLAAYPESAALRSGALRELRRVAGAARTLARGGGARRKRALDGSGVAWSESCYAFSWRIARWLNRSFPAHAELEADGVDASGVRQLLQLCLPRIELERLDEPHTDLAALLGALRGTSPGSNLGWLLHSLDRLPGGEAIREHLYDALEVPVRFAPRSAPLTRTLARGPTGPIFYHRSALEHEVELEALLEAPLPARMRLTAGERARVLDSARGVLATLGRETDTISFAWPAGVRAFALERGVTVVLYAALPEKRFPIDTHVGFMLFKNGLPAAYGGGWPFAGSCRIGINVFPAFRGGESARWFAEVMRVYRMRFAVERFVVEPYQFGAGNPEGLRSGAFWFYYRLGFRPVETRAARLAAEEFARIRTGRGYRTPLATMRALTRCDLALRLPWAAPWPHPWPEPYHLSIAVSNRIAREFDGNRELAQRAAMRRLRTVLGPRQTTRHSPAGDQAYAGLALLFAGIADLGRWSAADKRACAALLEAKSAEDEGAYLRGTQRHQRLRRALMALAESAGG